MLRFDDFAPGTGFGAAELTLDATDFANWCAVFPDDATLWPRMPAGMTSVVIMRAYMALIAPRPSGNVHGAQATTLHRLPLMGEPLHTRLSCTGKELKRDRSWVDFASETFDGTGASLFNGRMRILWAA